MFFGISILLFRISLPVLKAHFNLLPTISTTQEAKEYAQNKSFSEKYVQLKTNQIYDIDFVVETVKKENDKEVRRKNTSFFIMAELENGYILIEVPFNQYDKINFEKETVYAGILKEPASTIFVLDHAANILSKANHITSKEAKATLLSSVYINNTVISAGNTFFIISLIFLLLAVVLLISMIRSSFKK